MCAETQFGVSVQISAAVYMRSSLLWDVTRRTMTRKIGHILHFR